MDVWSAKRGSSKDPAPTQDTKKDPGPSRDTKKDPVSLSTKRDPTPTASPRTASSTPVSSKDAPKSKSSPSPAEGPTSATIYTPITQHTLQSLDEIHNQSIVVHDDEAFSNYAESIASDTTSLKSDIRHYQYENGRRYHRADDRNLLPNDETEQDRLDLHHYLFKVLLGDKNHLAPIRNPHRILDVGTGTGIWALDMADEYPSAVVTGTDLTPIQPSWTAPNCFFEIDDAEKDWTWDDNHFDFIHSRNVAQGIKDWSRYLSQMYRTLSPGGWIELMEIDTDIFSDDNSLKEGSAIVRVSKAWYPAAERLGMRLLKGEDYVAMAKEAGFVDVKLRKLKQPWAGWPKEASLKHAGRVFQLVLESGMVAYNMAILTRVLNMPVEEAEKLCQDALKESQDPKVHCYNYIWHIIARKPQDGEC